MYIHADFTCIHTIEHTVMLRRAVRLCDAISRSDLLMRDPRLFFCVKYNHILSSSCIEGLCDLRDL